MTSTVVKIKEILLKILDQPKSRSSSDVVVLGDITVIVTKGRVSFRKGLSLSLSYFFLTGYYYLFVIRHPQRKHQSTRAVVLELTTGL